MGSVLRWTVPTICVVLLTLLPALRVHASLHATLPFLDDAKDDFELSFPDEDEERLVRYV